ncbi:MAG: hypothetical protein Q8O67_28700 [Deltaproteobacteria bacterium]|nr:hypothetical protein [Deltaproteobacteria bacterium]
MAVRKKVHVRDTATLEALIRTGAPPVVRAAAVELGNVDVDAAGALFRELVADPGRRQLIEECQRLAGVDDVVQRAFAAGELAWTGTSRPPIAPRALTRLILQVTATLPDLEVGAAVDAVYRLSAYVDHRWFTGISAEHARLGFSDNDPAFVAACRAHQRAVLEDARLPIDIRNVAGAALVSHAPALVLAVHARAPICACTAWSALVLRVRGGETTLSLDERRALARIVVDEAVGAAWMIKAAGWPETLDLLRPEDAVVIAADVVDRRLDATTPRWLIDHSALGRVAALARIGKLRPADRLYLVGKLDPGERFDLVKDAWMDAKLRGPMVAGHMGLLIDDERCLDLALSSLHTDPASSFAVLAQHRSPRATAELENAVRVASPTTSIPAARALARRAGVAHASSFLAGLLDSGSYDTSVSVVAAGLQQLGLHDDVGAVDRALVRGVDDRAALVGAAESMRTRA